jgi:hypothetical protein
MENENVTNENENVEVQPNIEVKDNGSTLTAEVTPIDPMAAQEDPKDTETPEDKPEEDKTPEDKPEEDEQTSFDTQVERDNEIKNDLAKHNIDFDALGEEYQKNGELSKESIDKLEKAGYPKAMVDAYLDGLQATTEKFVNRIYSMAGGKENYEKILGFIKTQPESIVNAYNATITQGNLNQIELALNGIKAQMKTAYGTSNPTLMGGAATSTAEGYTSMEQMTKDMSDPRYQVDPKFTRSVMMKIKNANIF